MSNSIDRTSARSTKGWIAGEHLSATNLNNLLLDSESIQYIDCKKSTYSDLSISIERPAEYD